MKPAICFILGVVLGAMLLWLVLPHAGRYVISTQGSPENPLLVRLDTATGQCWHFQGGWIVMPEPK